jgi:hypothetical protein
MKLKTTSISILLGAILFFSCKGGDDPKDDFDHAAQALIDDEKIIEFMETHFYTPPAGNEDFGVIDTILNGETPIKEIAQIQEVTFSKINYKLYYIVAQPEGSGVNPVILDKVFTKYRGITLDYEQSQFDEKILYTWLSLGSVIPGWSYGFTNFKGGSEVISPIDMPIEFDQAGRGVLFIPSGLAYRNVGGGSISPNTNIYFHIKLGFVERGDQDLDGIYSLYEDLNENNDFQDDDSDEDNQPNYADQDDDNDGLFTIYENADPNSDGNPDDAVDTDGDNTPDYLDNDDDGDGIVTGLEDADPNGDGNPNDALDSDGDNIPDYLDPTN